MKWTYHVSASIVFSYYGLKQVRGLHASSSKKSGRWLFRANTVAWDCPQGTSLLLSLRSTLLACGFPSRGLKITVIPNITLCSRWWKGGRTKGFSWAALYLRKSPSSPGTLTCTPLTWSCQGPMRTRVLEIWGSLSGLYCRGWKFITVNGEQKNTPPA